MILRAMTPFQKFNKSARVCSACSASDADCQWLDWQSGVYRRQGDCLAEHKGVGG